MKVSVIFVAECNVQIDLEDDDVTYENIDEKVLTIINEQNLLVDKHPNWVLDTVLLR